MNVWNWNEIIKVVWNWNVLNMLYEVAIAPILEGVECNLSFYLFWYLSLSALWNNFVSCLWQVSKL